MEDLPEEITHMIASFLPYRSLLMYGEAKRGLFTDNQISINSLISQMRNHWDDYKTIERRAHLAFDPTPVDACSCRMYGDDCANCTNGVFFKTPTYNPPPIPSEISQFIKEINYSFLVEPLKGSFTRAVHHFLQEEFWRDCNLDLFQELTEQLRWKVNPTRPSDNNQWKWALCITKDYDHLIDEDIRTIIVKQLTNEEYTAARDNRMLDLLFRGAQLDNNFAFSLLLAEVKSEENRLSASQIDLLLQIALRKDEWCEELGKAQVPIRSSVLALGDRLVRLLLPTFRETKFDLIPNDVRSVFMEKVQTAPLDELDLVLILSNGTKKESVAACHAERLCELGMEVSLGTLKALLQYESTNPIFSKWLNNDATLYKLNNECFNHLYQDCQDLVTPLVRRHAEMLERVKNVPDNTFKNIRAQDADLANKLALKLFKSSLKSANDLNKYLQRVESSENCVVDLIAFLRSLDSSHSSLGCLFRLLRPFPQQDNLIAEAINHVLCYNTLRLDGTFFENLYSLKPRAHKETVARHLTEQALLALSVADDKERQTLLELLNGQQRLVLIEGTTKKTIKELRGGQERKKVAGIKRRLESVCDDAHKYGCHDQFKGLIEDRSGELKGKVSTTYLLKSRR